MTRPAAAASRGFTLVEAIVAMAVTGIVAGIVAVFMAAPIRAYLDSTRRAEITDAADLALRRIGYDLRRAVPNSVRLLSATSLEFIPAKDGGRYRQQGPGNVLDGSATGSATFDVLGPDVSGVANDYLVVFNTGQSGLDAYAGDNRRKLSGAAAATVSFTGNGTAYPPYHSPSQRFQLVPQEGPVRFACSAGTLSRETNYATGFSTGAGNQSAVLANGVACAFDYQPLNASNGLVSLRLTVAKDGESVTLLHQVHVDNAP